MNWDDVPDAAANRRKELRTPNVAAEASTSPGFARCTVFQDRELQHLFRSFAKTLDHPNLPAVPACGHNATPQVPRRRPMRWCSDMLPARIVREPQSIGGPSEMIGNDDRLRHRFPSRRLSLSAACGFAYLRRGAGMSKAECQMSTQARRTKHEQSFVICISSFGISASGSRTPALSNGEGKKDRCQAAEPPQIIHKASTAKSLTVFWICYLVILCSRKEAR